MRIALFTDTYRPTVNGVARALGLLVDHAAKAGHEVALVTPRVGEAAAGASFHRQLPGPRFPLYPELRACAPRLGKETLARLERFRPDVVHAATEAGVGLAGRSWASKNHVPLVTSFNTLFPEYLHDYRLGLLEASLWRYLRWFHGAAALTVTPSEWMRDELTRHRFHDRLGLWSRGVDSSLFHPRKRSWRLRHALAPEAEIILMYVGRIAREKKVDVLMDAFPQIQKRTRPRLALVMVGDGPALPELRARGLPGVHFTGYKHGEELAAHYASADLFVFPSDTETFGQVVTEAQASGLAAVVPDRGGVIDIVTPCLTGYRFAPGDAASLARAAAKLVNDPTTRLQMGARARAAAELRSWDRIFTGLFERYGSLREAGRTPPLARAPAALAGMELTV